MQYKFILLATNQLTQLRVEIYANNLDELDIKFKRIFITRDSSVEYCNYTYKITGVEEVFTEPESKKQKEKYYKVFNE